MVDISRMDIRALLTGMHVSAIISNDKYVSQLSDEIDQGGEEEDIYAAVANEAALYTNAFIARIMR